MKSLPVFLATALCLGLSAIHANATTQFEVTVNSGSPLADGATLDFGSVGLYMPKTLVVTIRNPGAEAPPLSLSINLTNSPGSDLYDFGVGAPNSPLTLGANESVAVPITLTATDPGTFTANLRVTETEDPDSTLGLTLTGTVLSQPKTGFNWNSADGNWDVDSNWNVGQVPPPTKTLNGQPYDSSVNITNGGVARKTGGLIQTGILSISNGTLVLADGANIANFLFTGGAIVDSPISIGENGTLRIGDGGAPGGSLSLTEQIQGMGTTGPGVGATIVFNHEAPFYQFAPRLTGSIKVRHEGTGTTTLLDTSNAHGGGNTVSGGLLEIDANSALGGPGSALHLDGGGIRWRGLAFNDLRAFTLGPNGGTLDTNGRSPVYAHVIPQNGPFTKRGAGSLILTQPHTVVTPWSVLEGSLRLRANMSFAPGTNLVGPGTVEIENATLTLDESSNIDIRFLNVAATLTGSEDVTVNGKLDFANEGKIRTTSPGSTLTIQGGMRLAAFSAVFDGRVIELASDTDHISGSVQLQNDAVINHHADSTWTAKGNNTIIGGTFNNAGTFARTTGTGTFTISSLFTNTGLVDIQSGTLSLTSGGTFTAGTFQIATQAGLSLSGTNLFGAGAAILGQPGSQLTIAGGTTFETARVFGSDFRINGTTLTLNGDTIFNGGVLLNNSSSTITGSGDVAINGLLDFTNEGKIRTTAPGSTLTIQGGMRINSFAATFDGRIIELASDTEHIRGTVHILNGAVLNHHPGSTWLTTGNHDISGGTFNNAGTFTRNGGTGISKISSAFTNTATVNANTGILTFSSTFTQTAGSLHLDGGTIRKTGTPINIAGGSVKGSGTIDGNLDINGGRIVLDIAGNSPGVSHDQFVVTGTTDFGPGVVEVAFSNGFAPQMGQEFVLLISAGLSGTPQIQITGLAPGWQFTTQYDPATDEFTLTSLSDGVATSGSPPPLTLAAPTFSPPPAATNGKSITTIASGPPGAVVRLEASDNLSEWTTLATETIDGSGNGVFSNIHDPLAGDRRFYRLATP